MKLQAKVIGEFKLAYSELTFNQMTDLTGIERTRLFRIFNGYEMKLSEYEVISTLLRKSIGNKDCLTNIAFEYTKNIKEEECSRASVHLKRKLRWSTIMNSGEKVKELRITA